MIMSGFNFRNFNLKKKLNKNQFTTNYIIIYILNYMLSNYLY